MNLLHLKYAVEVANAGSISKAANNLFMNQPHLSKIIKDLEENMNIVIFERTSKGVVVTKKGQEFIEQAKNIIMQVEQLEAKYKGSDDQSINLDLCVSKACYIEDVFIDYLSKINFKDKNIKVNYHEANTFETIKKVSEGEADIGVIRFFTSENNYFINILDSKDLEYEEIAKFNYCLLLNKNNKLAFQDNISLANLSQLTQIVYGDEQLSSRKINSNKTITIYHRGIQYKLLQRLVHTYMWSSPIPDHFLQKYDLVMKECSDYQLSGSDLLIKRKGYRLTKDDQNFVDEMKRKS